MSDVEMFKTEIIGLDFFEKILGVENKEAQINACKVEHVLTKNAFDKLCKFVENYKN